MSMISKYLGKSKKRAIIIGLSITLILILTSVSLALQGAMFKRGYVGAKGFVKKDGAYVMVEYDNDNRIATGKRWIINDDLAGCIALSAEDYTYEATKKGVTFSLNPDTRSVLAIETTMELKAQSPYRFGYLTAYYSKDPDVLPEAGDRSLDSLNSYQYGDTAWAPLENVKIILPAEEPVGTDKNGFYLIGYSYPPECMPASLDTHLFAELRFTNFDPRTGPLGYYLLSRPTTLHLGGDLFLCDPWHVAFVANLMSQLPPDLLWYNNFSVDVAMLTGGGYLVNELYKKEVYPNQMLIEPGVLGPVKLFDKTVYKCDRPVFELNDLGQYIFDFDQSHTPDTVTSHDSQYIKVTLPRDMGLDPESFYRLVDYKPDQFHRGLLKTISIDDLQDTDVYVYRTSDNTLLTSRKGLKPEESNPFHGGGAFTGDENAKLHFKMLIRSDPTKINTDRFLPEKVNLGDRLKIILINRATGYIGTEETTVTKTDSNIDITPKNFIAMHPPNLKIMVKRIQNDAAFPTGLPDKRPDKGDDKPPWIGYQGTGLIQDTMIIIRTEWTDWDGSPLPQDLPGYTGRIARIVSDKKLDTDTQNKNAVGTFAIQPGVHTVIVKDLLKSTDPGQIPDLVKDLEKDQKAYFYIQVNGHSPESSASFATTEFATLGGENAGPMLQYRPKHFVPVLVPIYDEQKTWENKIKNIDQLEYDWVYRPDMAFSLIKLDITQARQEEDHIVTVANDDKDFFLDLATPNGNFIVALLDPYYTDPGDPENGIPPQTGELPLIGPDRQYLFEVGGQEIPAILNGQNRLWEMNPTHLDLFTAADYLALNLVQNGDDPNVLWQYRALEIMRIQFVKRQMSEDRSTGSIPVGGQGQVEAVSVSGKHDVNWKILFRSDGVKANIDNDGIITVRKTSDPGYIKIQATDKNDPRYVRAAYVKIGCASCQTATGKCSQGTFECNLKSFDVQINLGQSEADENAGNLYIRSKEIEKNLGSPQFMEFSTLTRDERVESLYTAEKELEQVVTPNNLIVVDKIDESAYTVSFLDISAKLEKLPTGLYDFDKAVAPIATYTIENITKNAALTKDLKITESRGGKTNVNEYFYDEEKKEWTLSRANGEQIETLKETVDSNGNRQVRRKITDSATGVASDVQKTYKEFAWGEDVIETVIDPDGEAITTTYTYEQDSSADGYGQVKSEVNQDESWRRYYYEEDRTNHIQRLKQTTSAVLDASATTPEASARTVSYKYNAVDPSDVLSMGAGSGDSDSYRYQPRTVTERYQNQVISKTYYAYIYDIGSKETREVVERCVRPDAQYGDSDNLRTVTTYYPQDSNAASAAKIKQIKYPDGRLDQYTYEYGAYDGSIFSVATGRGIREIVVHGTVASPEGIAFKTTREINISDREGNLVRQDVFIKTDSGYEPVSWTAYTYDNQGHLIQTQRSDGTQTDSAYNCCTKDYDRDAQGIKTDYTYDDLLRVETITRPGPIGPIVTDYTYDASGRRLTQTVTAGGINLSSSNHYHKSGHLDYSTDTAGRTTFYWYSSDGRTTTVTRPGNITETTKTYIDGRTKSVTGTGVIPRYYTYGVNPDGTQWTQVNTGTPDSVNWEKSTTDLLGRTIKTERPGYSGTLINQNSYNDKGQLVKTTTTGQADVLYVYDDLGNQIHSGLDIDHNGILEPGSTDRITASDTAFVQIDSAWWQETVQQVFAKDSDATATTISTQRTQMSGLGSGLVSNTVSIDINGNQTTAQTHIDRSARTETRNVDHPDSETDSQSISVNGYLVSSTSQTGLTTTFGYDALGRRIRVTDPRIGDTTTHYNALGQVDYIQDPAGNQTQFGYDPTTGRKISETNALTQTTRFAYNERGQVTQTWGDNVYPVAYQYDAYGRLSEMHTFRSELGWNNVTWPDGSEATADTTKWHYQEETGLLIAKEDAQGKQVAYTYQADGKLATRTWARLDAGNPLTTTYHYDADTGELLTIDYSDTTPDITFTYDRLGRQKTVTDALGSRSFGYNASLQLETETITGLYNKTLTRTYETSNVIGRNTGFTLDSNYIVTYGFDSKGRFNSVGWNVNSQTGMATYGYLPNSNLLESVATLAAKNTTYTYEPHRNLKTQVQNSSSGMIVSQYDYAYDELGRRTSVQNSGLAFGTPAFNKWGYNTRSELTESRRYNGSDINDTSLPVDPETRLYNYDPIGNRSTSTEGSTDSAYSANNLNQYDNVTTGGNTQPLGYDEDGNLTSYSGKILKYNAENRLISVQPVTPAMGDKKVEFVYDFGSRRVKKTIYNFSGTWQLEKEILFVYNGWNLAEEITKVGASEISKFFVWGMDLSQSLQGAGGVGGLLATIDNGTTYYNFYDGNGNTGQLVNGSDGSIAASYEYDPFGKIIKDDGAYAQENMFRFSTKYMDFETGLVYYGYRYYMVGTGRWLSRDPIEEKGCLNLYNFCRNNSISHIDYNGKFEMFEILEKIHSIIKSIGSGIGYALNETDKFLSHMPATGAAAEIAIILPFFSGMAGINAMFFPESCEIAMYRYLSGSFSIFTDIRDEDKPIPKSLPDAAAQIFRGLSVGNLIGISATLVKGMPINDVPHNAESWLGWFWNVELGYEFISGSIFGGLPVNGARNGWIGMAGGVGISVPSPITRGITGGIVATYYSFLWNNYSDSVIDFDDNGCICKALRAINAAYPLKMSALVTNIMAIKYAHNIIKYEF